jgi:hypothetical protein
VATIKEWQKQVHQLAREKGWYEAERSPLEIHMLIVSEIAEATEEARAGRSDIYFVPDGMNPDKPEGEMVELADAAIRIMDYFEAKGWDLEKAIMIKHGYNIGRPHRHGGKRF